jgi:hypothetical protein
LLYSQGKAHAQNEEDARIKETREVLLRNMDGLSDQIKYARGWSMWDQESRGGLVEGNRRVAMIDLIIPQGHSTKAGQGG